MRSAETRMLNETLVAGLTSKNDLLEKEAIDGLNDYLRITMREDGFARRLCPPVDITAGDLDRQVDTSKPVIVRDKEPNSPPAYSVPFGTTPMNTYIKGPRYRVMMDRIESRRFSADVNTLLTYDMDIRQILNDYILKDIMGEEDRKWMIATDWICGAGRTVSAGVVKINQKDPATGSSKWVDGGLMNREGLANMMKGLPSSIRHLNPATALVNNLTIWDVVALGRDEIGGNLAEELFVNGFAERIIMGIPWVITIKTDIVGDGTVYQYTEPKYLGDFIILDDITVSTKNENYMIEFFGYESIGATIANDAAVCRCDFLGTSGTVANWKPAAVWGD
jgi:hypothetical protein